MSWNDMGAEIITTRHVERKHSTDLRDPARALSSLNRLFFRGVIMGLLLSKTHKNRPSGQREYSLSCLIFKLFV